jgi:hypothetical protein
MSVDVIENMFPFERDVYTMLLKQWIQEENERRKREAMNG